MVFKNEDEFKKYLMGKCRIAIANTENKIYLIIKKALVEFYKDYDPILYDRTLQLMHSLVKSNIRQVADGYEAEVYFDLSSISYEYGNRPTGEEVMAAASQGLHGAIGDNFAYKIGRVDVWNTPLTEIDSMAIDTVVRELKAQGIQIK